jgi:molybdopterin/thiamine biosynthesis adenylyltransferase
MSDDNRWLSRERAAGYRPEVLRRARVLLGGAGAGANNAALTLALSTVGEVLVVDFDAYEEHNATRSPFYPTGEEQQRLGLGKAKVVAHKMARIARSTLEPGQ